MAGLTERARSRLRDWSSVGLSSTVGTLRKPQAIIVIDIALTVPDLVYIVRLRTWLRTRRRAAVPGQRRWDHFDRCGAPERCHFRLHRW